MAPFDGRNAVVVFMVCTWLGLQYSACVAQHDRLIILKEPRLNKILVGHVISKDNVRNEGSCRVKCYMKPNCVSINMRPLTGGKLYCELNNATDEKEFASALEDKPHYTYLAIENPCSNNPCFNGGTCQAGFSSKGFLCRCSPGFNGTDCEATSCSHLKKLVPTAESGNHVIDPDGDGGLPPFGVTCNMTDKYGVTVISHDSESRTLVNESEKAGRYSRDIHYKGASLRQLASLTRVSSHCEQFIKYECYSSKLHNQYKNWSVGWWVSRDNKKMTYWDGASGWGKCACAKNNTCANPERDCNCDKNDFKWREDNGLLTNKTHLPVKQLRFGDTGFDKGKDELGYHTLGKFKCYQTID